MNSIKAGLISNAISKHKRIFPCRGCRSLEECFTFEKGMVIFWYNTEDESTHMLSAQVLY